ncbi:MAG: sodium/solute symporter [Cytophagaceae bacterium]|nr:sodium/solute symporter [Cytophagaceae bacterium]
MKEISFFDVSVIAIFFLLIFFVGFLYSKSRATVEEYLVSPRSTGWVVLGLAAFAVNTSSSTLMIISASAHSSGMIIFNYELTGIVCCLIFAFIFGPVYFRNKIKTIPEYLELRFNSTTRIIFSALTILTHIFTKISIYLFAGGIFLQQITDMDIYSLMLFITIVTGIYSILDGQKPIIHTQMTQAIFILTGGAILFYFVINAGQGFEDTLGKVAPAKLDLIKPASDAEYPWPGLFFSLFIVGIWYHCLDAEMAQKFLSGKTLQDSQASIIFLGFLKFSILFIVIVPGIFGSVLFPEISNDIIYSGVFQKVVPEGLKGFVIAGFLAALMSSLSASFNACSALYTFDIYKKLYPHSQNFILINIGKIGTIVIVILSMNWIVFIKFLQHNTFQFVASAFSYMTPPIVAVFSAGIFSKTASPKAATATLIIGSIISFLMIMIQVVVKTEITGSDILTPIVNFNFLYFTVISFLFYLALIFIVSYFDTPINNSGIMEVTLNSLTWKESLNSSKIKVAGILLFIIVTLIYILLHKIR